MFLSENTHNSTALREEIDYGINVLGLPVIVVYPDYKYNSSIADGNKPNSIARALWENLPVQIFVCKLMNLEFLREYCMEHGEWRVMERGEMLGRRASRPE